MASNGYDDEEKQIFVCLFCPLPSPTLAIFHDHLTAAHNVTLPPILTSLTFYQRIRLINYCRARTKDGFGVADVVEGLSMDEWREDDALLQPVLPDDAVLISLDDDEGGDLEDDEDVEGLDDDVDEDEEEWDEEDDEEDAEDEEVESTVRQCQQREQQPSAAHTTYSPPAQWSHSFDCVVCGIQRERMLRETRKAKVAQERTHQRQQQAERHVDSSDTVRLKREIAQQRAQVEQLTEALAAMQAALHNMTLAQSAQPQSPPTQLAHHDDNEQDTPPPLASQTNGTSTTSIPAQALSDSSASLSTAPRRSLDVDSGYFGGYSTRHIHELMLKDKHRTLSYQSFLYNNQHLLKDKVVLDVGCGTGILSLFAAKAGARLVVGVDAADIADKAREIVELNGYEGRVVIVKGKMEEVTLPVEKVDVIISEWMGYFLLYESMLPSVLFARDRYLSNPAHCYPDVAVLYVAGMHDRRSRGEWVDWWKDVYGFDMSPLVTDADRHLGSSVETVQAADVVTSTCELKRFDVGSVRAEELDWSSDFNVRLTTADTVDALVVHFDTLFQRGATEPVSLTTSPSTPPTHWMQTVFRLHQSVGGEAGEGVAGVMEAKRLKRYVRGYGVKLVYWKVDTTGKETGQRYVQEYTIE